MMSKVPDYCQNTALLHSFAHHNVYLVALSFIVVSLEPNNIAVHRKVLYCQRGMHVFTECMFSTYRREQKRWMWFLHREPQLFMVSCQEHVCISSDYVEQSLVHCIFGRFNVQHRVLLSNVVMPLRASTRFCQSYHSFLCKQPLTTKFLEQLVPKQFKAYLPPLTIVSLLTEQTEQPMTP